MVKVLPIHLDADGWIAVQKPPGWLIHRSPLDPHETRIVLQALRDQLGQRVYPVHRLDKGTCGVLLVALNPDAARALGHAFKTHQVHKRYLAFVRGWPSMDEVLVDHALKPDDAPDDAAVQPAQTRIRALARFEVPESSDGRFSTTRVALVEAQPLTGRRHQIRRHLKHIAHPIIGDATHGKGPLNRWWAERLGHQRLWLHAQALTFPHPVTGERTTVESGIQWTPGAMPADGTLAVAEGLREHESARQWLALWEYLRPYVAGSRTK